MATSPSRRADRGPYSTFRTAYRNDPVAFVHDCLRFREGEHPTEYQDGILADLASKHRVAVRGPHGLGKTALASWAILWFSLTRDVDDDWKNPTTASAWRQLTLYLWPEVKKWARQLRWDKIGRDPFSDRDELLSLNLKLTSGEAFALASSDANLIEGAHATSLMYVFDESKAIPEEIWDAAEGAFSAPGSAETFALAISTPGEPHGRFYDIHSRKPGYEDWAVRHVSVTEAIDAGRISPEWVEQRKRQWGEKSAVYQNRVLGEFAVDETDGVIPLAWIERANELWYETQSDEHDVTYIGVDVARSGSAKTVIAIGNGSRIHELRRYEKADTMETAGRVVGILSAHEGSKAVVDVVGLGAGVVDRVREQGYTVLAFGAGESTDKRDKSGELRFADKRSAAWWSLREQLEDGLLALVPDDMLTGDLTAPKWRVVSGGRIRVESKEDVSSRLKRSTDDGDAVVMQAAGPELVGEDWFIY